MIALFATITDKDRNKRKGFLEPHPQELPNGTVYSLRISQRSAAIFDFLLFRLSETLTLGRKRATRGSSFTFSIMTWQIWLAVNLRVYADALDGEIYHYRDKNNLECDAVLHRRNGSFGLIEIQLDGDAAVEHGTSTLRMLAAKIDVEKMGKPSFLMVLTAVGDFAYQREDGVLVVPICCLRD